MGFRDLEIFNDALLAKQAWRILENPTSLYARVLKARYFPHEEFLTAGGPASASKTWKEIIQGREMLKKGLIRRIGNGETTEVWHDHWIDGTISMKPMGALQPNSVQFVSDLLDPMTNQWNTELIQSIFYAPDAAAILAMARPRVGGADVWAWAKEKSGLFTVRSVYRHEMETRSQGTESSGSSSGDTTIWKALWKINVLPKIRVFWWRVLKNFLPSYGELQRRHIKQLPHCPMCGHDNETLFH